MSEKLFSFDSDCVVTHTKANQSAIDKSIPSQYCEWWKRERLKRVAEHQRNLEIDARNRAEKRESEMSNNSARNEFWREFCGREIFTPFHLMIAAIFGICIGLLISLHILKPTGEHKMPLNDQQTEIKDG